MYCLFYQDSLYRIILTEVLLIFAVTKTGIPFAMKTSRP
jgi:hypothetical protein